MRRRAPDQKTGERNAWLVLQTRWQMVMAIEAPLYQRNYDGNVTPPSGARQASTYDIARTPVRWFPSMKSWGWASTIAYTPAASSAHGAPGCPAIHSTT